MSRIPWSASRFHLSRVASLSVVLLLLTFTEFVSAEPRLFPGRRLAERVFGPPSVVLEVNPAPIFYGPYLPMVDTNGAWISFGPVPLTSAPIVAVPEVPFGYVPSVNPTEIQVPRIPGDSRNVNSDSTEPERIVEDPGDAELTFEDRRATLFRSTEGLHEPIPLDPRLRYPAKLELTLTDLEFENGWAPPPTVPGPYVLQIFTANWFLTRDSDRPTRVYLARIIGEGGAVAAGFDEAQPQDWNISVYNKPLSQDGVVTSVIAATTLSRLERIDGSIRKNKQSIALLVEDEQLVRLEMRLPVNRRRGLVMENVVLVGALPVESVPAADLTPIEELPLPLPLPSSSSPFGRNEPVPLQRPAVPSSTPAPPLPEILPPLEGPK